MREHRFVLALLRVAFTVLMAFSLSGVSHAAEEIVEDAMHRVETGHGAHVDRHPEGTAARGTEHFCFGSVHHCGCCATTVGPPPRRPGLPLRASDRVRYSVRDLSGAVDGVRTRLDRPPRA